MAEITTDNISELWSYIGSIWGNLEDGDRNLIEELWLSYSSCVEELDSEINAITNNRSIRDITPILVENDNFYDIIYDTSDEDKYGHLVNTYANESGLIVYPLGSMITSVSGVVNYYYQDEANEWISQPLSEGVDFTIEGYNSIVFLKNPPFTLSLDYPTLSRSLVYVERLEKVNPVLFEVWGAMVGFNSDLFVSGAYSPWSQYAANTREHEIDKASHYKQIIQALIFWQRQPPTINTIRNSLGVAYGLPFSYESGILAVVSGGGSYYGEINDQRIWLSNDTELSYLVSGTYDRFEILVDTYALDDYISNSALIVEHADSSLADQHNILVLQINSGLASEFPFIYDQNFYDEWINRAVPSYHKLLLE